MSEAIGPIHQWLYHKIIMQESINMQIFYLAEVKGWKDSLEKLTNKKIGQVSFGPLEEIVDLENVHGWLQERVEIEESRFAFAVMTLVKEDATRFEDIQNCMYEFGSKVQYKDVKDAIEITVEIDRFLLNGMPCDNVTSVINKSEDCVETEIKKQIHAPFWEAQGGTNDMYLGLIDSFIQGMINKSGFSYCREGKIKKIYRKQG